MVHVFVLFGDGSVDLVSCLLLFFVRKWKRHYIIHTFVLYLI